MGVAIDETRHHDPPRRVDFHRVAQRREIFHAARWPHLAQYAAADQSRSLGDYAQFVQPDSATRCSRAAKRQKLFRASYKCFSQEDTQFTVTSVKSLITRANYGEIPRAVR